MSHLTIDTRNVELMNIHIYEMITLNCMQLTLAETERVYPTY